MLHQLYKHTEPEKTVVPKEAKNTIAWATRPSHEFERRWGARPENGKDKVEEKVNGEREAIVHTPSQLHVKLGNSPDEICQQRDSMLSNKK